MTRELESVNKELSSCKQDKADLAEQNSQAKLNILQEHLGADRKRPMYRERGLQAARVRCEETRGLTLSVLRKLYNEERHKCRRILIDFETAKFLHQNEQKRRQRLYEYLYWTGMVSNPATEEPPTVTANVEKCLALSDVNPFLAECTYSGTRVDHAGLCLAMQLRNAFDKVVGDDTNPSVGKLGDGHSIQWN